MLKAKSNSEVKNLVVVISLTTVKNYLTQTLDSHECEDEVAYSVLNLIATAVMTLTKQDYTEPDEIDVAVNYLEGVNGFTKELAHEVCKNAEAMIFHLVYEHIPDFGADHYYGNTSLTINNELAFLTIDTAAFSVSP